LKAIREKKQIICKCKHIKITEYFSMATLKARRVWSEVFWTKSENNFNFRMLYPEKLSFKIDRAIEIFHNKQKLKQYMTSKPPVQKILQELCTQKIKANKITKGQAVSNHRRRKGKKVESNIDSAAHNQTLKQ
jgi:hypothetical protein